MDNPVTRYFDYATQYRCPRCGYTSGNDWTQCENRCPMIQSPHYDSSWTEDDIIVYEKERNDGMWDDGIDEDIPF